MNESIRQGYFAFMFVMGSINAIIGTLLLYEGDAFGWVNLVIAVGALTFVLGNE
jgi:hypothetical protein